MSERLGTLLEGFTPRALVTLGSGLGALADDVADPRVLDLDSVGLPGPTVPGHAGRLVAGHLGGLPVLVQQGRVHLYEGVDPRAVTAVVRAAADAGAEVFVVTNAAGGLVPDLAAGDLLAITDHLNLTGVTPLTGPEFVDLRDAYDPGLRALAHEAAGEVGERIAEGVYAGVRGPAFETPAEVRMLRVLGADVVGMSTVLEVIAARATGMRVVGLSLVTNVHDGGSGGVDHAQVLDVAQHRGPRLAALVRALLARLHHTSGEATVTEAPGS